MWWPSRTVAIAYEYFSQWAEQYNTAGCAQPAVFMPDFDPGALETLLAIAARSNNRDLWAIIPKQAGSVEAVQLATYPDEQGT